jgi:hypothetical protein
VPVLLLSEGLTVAANHLLGVDPFLKGMSAAVIVFMSLALVGLATGLGARYPRFGADNSSQVAGSYGGVAFMVMAVLFVLTIIVLVGWPSSVYLFHQVRHQPLDSGQRAQIYLCFLAAGALSLGTWWFGMASGVRALEAMDRTPQ